MEGQYNRIWEYTSWSNNAVLEAFANLGEKSPASSLRLMSHVVNAQMIWQNRLNGDASVVALWEEHSLKEIVRRNSESLRGLKKALDRNADDLTHKIAYKNLSGVAHENTVFDILTHVFNHGTYHRAQIATDFREKGLVPVNTDYITFVWTH